VISACLSDLGYSVAGVDPAEGVARRIAELQLPVYEPQLERKIKKGLSKGLLSFSSDFATSIPDCGYVIFAQDTPVSRSDTPVLEPLFRLVHSFVPHPKEDFTLIISSQVPVGTCEKIATAIHRQRKGLGFTLGYVPENLKLGEAVTRFEHPGMLVIGSNSSRFSERVKRLYAPIKAPRVVVPVRTAEMVKHTINTYLALQVSYANEIGNLSDKFGIDSLMLTRIMRLDERIGERGALSAGLGFAGGTLARDVRTLQNLGKAVGYKTHLIDGILRVNRNQNEVVMSILMRRLGGLRGRKVGVLGLTYKPGTSSIRRSAAVEIVRSLRRRGAEVMAFDPEARARDVNRLLGTTCPNAYEAAGGAEALLILTAWPAFKRLDFKRLASAMRTPLLIDAQNLLSQNPPAAAGFTYVGIGRGSS